MNIEFDCPSCGKTNKIVKEKWYQYKKNPESVNIICGNCKYKNFKHVNPNTKEETRSKGRIESFFSKKGFGFIRDENGDSRFFHISNVKTSEMISEGYMVEFTPGVNEKGFIATNIKVTLGQKPNFISFGDVRIKINNIKNYGVDYENEKVIDYVQKINLSTGEKIIKRVFGVPLTILAWEDDATQGLGVLEESFKNYREETIYKTIKHTILYISTYQGDNFRFNSKNVRFNVNDKVKELDDYLGI